MLTCWGSRRLQLLSVNGGAQPPPTGSGGGRRCPTPGRMWCQALNPTSDSEEGPRHLPSSSGCKPASACLPAPPHLPLPPPGATVLTPLVRDLVRAHCTAMGASGPVPKPWPWPALPASTPTWPETCQQALPTAPTFALHLPCSDAALRAKTSDFRQQCTALCRTERPSWRPVDLAGSRATPAGKRGATGSRKATGASREQVCTPALASAELSPDQMWDATVRPMLPAAPCPEPRSVCLASGGFYGTEGNTGCAGGMPLPGQQDASDRFLLETDFSDYRSSLSYLQVIRVSRGACSRLTGTS